MDELEVTWGRAASVWWLLIWRGWLGGVLIGGLIGFAIAVVVALSGAQVGHRDSLAALLGLWAGLAWWLVAVRMALLKQYRDFRIVLVPRITYHVQDGVST